MHSSEPGVRQDVEDAEPDCPGDTLKERLAAAWQNKRWAEFYGTASTELQERIVVRLVKKGLTHEDAEDCMIQALEGIYKKQTNGKASIKDPQSYLWRSAINAGNDKIKKKRLEARLTESVGHELRQQERQRLDQVNSAETAPPEDFGPITERAAIVLTESILEDIEAEGPWAVRVVTIAIDRLRPALCTVARHMLKYGPKCKSTDAEADLGMRAGTYRPNRSKAIAELRRLIPEVMAELGINPAILAPPDIGITEPGDFPSADDTEGD